MIKPLSPDEMFPARSSDISQRFVELRTGMRIRVAEHGPREGTAVLMLPGWGGTLYMYRHGLDELARRGVRAIAADLRGFGLSDRPQKRGAYTLEAYLADLDALIDALGVERPLIVGQSMGGGIVLHYALRHAARVRGVALINPAGLTRLQFLPLLQVVPRSLIAGIGSRAAPRFMIEQILKRVAYGDPALVTEQDVDEYWAPTQLPGYVFAARAVLGEFDWRRITDEAAASLAVPSMVILGARDRLIPITDRDALRLAGAEVHRLAGGHCAHEEDPRHAYGLIAKFLDGTK